MNGLFLFILFVIDLGISVAELTELVPEKRLPPPRHYSHTPKNSISSIPQPTAERLEDVVEEEEDAVSKSEDNGVDTGTGANGIGNGTDVQSSPATTFNNASSSAVSKLPSPKLSKTRTQRLIDGNTASRLSTRSSVASSSGLNKNTTNGTSSKSTTNGTTNAKNGTATTTTTNTATTRIQQKKQKNVRIGDRTTITSMLATKVPPYSY